MENQDGHFLKSFDIRWGELDPNRHVANTAYVAFMNETRMSFMRSRGLTQQRFGELGVGPVILDEQFRYLKEVMPDERVFVDVQLAGHTPDFKFCRFVHHLYKKPGVLAVFSELNFAWFDLEERKVIAPPKPIREILEGMPRTENYRLLTPSDLKLPPDFPKGRTLDSVNWPS